MKSPLLTGDLLLLEHSKRLLDMYALSLVVADDDGGTELKPAPSVVDGEEKVDPGAITLIVPSLLLLPIISFI